MRMAVLLLLISALPSPVPAAEFRGLWVDTYHAGIRSAEEIDQLIADARAANINALIVQVRRRGNAFYRSQFEPTAFDVEPQSFDPLADLIAKAHDTSTGPRLEVHAWMVTYPIWDRRNGQPRQATHPYSLHPDWLTQNMEGEKWSSSGYVFDPGHPGVQEHTYNVAMDIIANYDVDGLNLDYVRYDGLSWGYNEVAINRFNNHFERTGRPAPSDPDWMQWRRDQVTALVRRIYLSAAVISPQVKISADTICFAPGVTSLRGWTRASNAYTSVLQDWRSWMEEGILDINIPMAYFDHEGNHMESWLNWNTFIKNHRYGRHAAIGVGSYLNTISNTVAQIQQTRATTASGNAADGVAIYSYAAPVIDESLAFGQLASTLTQGKAPNAVTAFTNAVPVPEAEWKTRPTLGHLKGSLTISGTDGLARDDVVRVDAADGKHFVQPDANGAFGMANVPPGEYRIVASRDGFMPVITNHVINAGSVEHVDIVLNPLPPASAPVVALQPEDDSGLFGDPVVLQSIGAASTPVAYQWYFGLTPVPGATNSTLAFESIDFNAAGAYSLIMSNDFGAVTSEVATVTVNTPEGIYAVRSSAGYDSAVVSWRTSEPGDATVAFGPGSNLLRHAFLPWSRTTNHTVRLAELLPNTSYQFLVRTRGDETDFTADGFSFRTAGEIIIDDTEAAFSGGWTTGTTAGGRYGRSYRFAGTTRSGASSTATYRPNLSVPGRYDIDIWHPHGSNRSTKTPHIITFSGGSITNLVDQTQDGGHWQELAADLPMQPADDSGVRISNDTGEPAKVVIADAVRFNYLRAQDVPGERELPLWWSMHFFKQAAPGTEDPDADLYSNHEEYHLGSDPTETGSSILVQSVIDRDGRLHVVFSPRHPDRTYQLEFTTGLERREWVRVPEIEQTMTPTFHGVISTELPPNRQIIFRIIADRPVFGPPPPRPEIVPEIM